MKPEEYLPFLLNQFIPDGMKEDDLPTWVKKLKINYILLFLRSLSNLMKTQMKLKFLGL